MALPSTDGPWTIPFGHRLGDGGEDLQLLIQKENWLPFAIALRLARQSENHPSSSITLH